jgi:hypothetical protein
MASLFEHRQVIQGALLIRRISLNRVDHDHGIQVIKHSRASRRSCTARGVQFLVSFGILFNLRPLFGFEVRLRSTGKAAC